MRQFNRSATEQAAKMASEVPGLPLKLGQAEVAEEQAVLDASVQEAKEAFLAAGGGQGSELDLQAGFLGFRRKQACAQIVRPCQDCLRLFSWPCLMRHSWIRSQQQRGSQAAVIVVPSLSKLPAFCAAARNSGCRPLFLKVFPCLGSARSNYSSSSGVDIDVGFRATLPS